MYTSERFQKACGVFIHTHGDVYFRETNQVTKARERMEAAASEENGHEVVLFGCASPPCSADTDLERFYIIKKWFYFFFIQRISWTKPIFCTVIIWYVLTLILQWRRVTIWNQTDQFWEFAELQISYLISEVFLKAPPVSTIWFLPSLKHCW